VHRGSRWLLALLLLLLLLLAARLPGATDLHEAQKHLDAGRAALDKKEWTVAQREFTSALYLEPLLAVAHYGLGKAQMGQRQYAAACESFSNSKRAIEHLAAAERTAASEAETRNARSIEELRNYIDGLRAAEQAFSGQGEGSSFSAITRVEQQINQIERNRGSLSGTAVVPTELSFSLGSAQLLAGRLEEASAPSSRSWRVPRSSARPTTTWPWSTCGWIDCRRPGPHSSGPRSADSRFHPR